MAAETYYDRLGLSPHATSQDIKAAFRQLARELHPDALPADTPATLRQLAQAEFNRLQQAYQVLSEPGSRYAYDRDCIDAAYGYADPYQSHHYAHAAPPPPAPPYTAPSQPAPPPYLVLATPPPVSPPPPMPVVAPPSTEAPWWQLPLISGVVGGAVAVVAIALFNGFSLISQPAVWRGSGSTARVEASPALSQNSLSNPSASPVTSAANELSPSPQHPTPAQQTAASVNDFEPAIAALDPPPAEPDPELTRGEITRFTAALLQLRPLLRAAEQQISDAKTDDERAAIEAQFNEAAATVIEARGLSTEEYHHIATLARTNAEIRQAVVSAAAQLQRSR